MTYLVAENKGKVQVEKVDNTYVVSFISKTGKVKFKEEYPKEPIVKDYKNGLMEIGISLGSPNYYCHFVDLDSGEVSQKIFYNPVAIDVDNHYIAETEDDSEQPSLNVYSIFDADKPLLRIRRDYSPAAALFSAIQEAKFLDGNRIYLRYLSGENYAEIEETIQFNER